MPCHLTTRRTHPSAAVGLFRRRIVAERRACDDEMPRRSMAAARNRGTAALLLLVSVGSCFVDHLTRLETPNRERGASYFVFSLQQIRKSELSPLEHEHASTFHQCTNEKNWSRSIESSLLSRGSGAKTQLTRWETPRPQNTMQNTAENNWCREPRPKLPCDTYVLSFTPWEPLHNTSIHPYPWNIKRYAFQHSFTIHIELALAFEKEQSIHHDE